MDMTFMRRAERILGSSGPAPLAHELLVASLAAVRPQRAPAERTAGPRDDPLIELVLTGPRWREALTEQRGCFSRAEAGRGVNTR